mgnify:CR=1 FL=1
MESENPAILDKIKQDLAQFRAGNHAKNHRLPSGIQSDILKLYKLGWKGPKINKTFNIATSTIYKLIRLSKNTSNFRKQKRKSKKQIQKMSIEPAKRLKLVSSFEKTSESGDKFLKKDSAFLKQDILAQVEFRSGIKLNLRAELLNAGFLKVLNTLE